MATRTSNRPDKVGDQLRDIIASSLITDASDPRLQQVHIQEVKVTHDLSFARVFWVPLLNEMDTERERKRFQRALESASGFLRGQIANAMRTRIVPQLRFEYDVTAEQARHMDELLASIDIPEAGDDEDPQDD
jgi:ribosome-binding factor A